MKSSTKTHDLGDSDAKELVSDCNKSSLMPAISTYPNLLQTIMFVVGVRIPSRLMYWFYCRYCTLCKTDSESAFKEDHAVHDSDYHQCIDICDGIEGVQCLPPIWRKFLGWPAYFLDGLKPLRTYTSISELFPSLSFLAGQISIKDAAKARDLLLDAITDDRFAFEHCQSTFFNRNEGKHT